MYHNKHKHPSLTCILNMLQPQAHSKSSDATLASNGHVCPFCLITHDSEHDNRKWRLLKEIITTERSRRRPIPDPSQSESPGLSYELHPAEEPDSSLLRAGNVLDTYFSTVLRAIQDRPNSTIYKKRKRLCRRSHVFLAHDPTQDP